MKETCFRNLIDVIMKPMMLNCLLSVTRWFLTDDIDEIDIPEESTRPVSFNFCSCCGVPNNMNSGFDGFKALKDSICMISLNKLTHFAIPGSVHFS